MANHDFILVYDEELEGWLRGEGCSVPAARPGNRYPTKEEVIAAVEAEGLQAVADGSEYIEVVPLPEAPGVVHEMTRVLKFVEWSGGQMIESRPPLSRLVSIHSPWWDELNTKENASITMRSNFPLELFLVRTFTECCGQLVLYPDTGDPPVVVDSSDNISRTAGLWLESVKAQTSWAKFYEQIGTPE